ncbi:hypothetical protein [Desulfotomaculum defluvii]
MQSDKNRCLIAERVPPVLVPGRFIAISKSHEYIRCPFVIFSFICGPLGPELDSRGSAVCRYGVCSWHFDTTVNEGSKPFIIPALGNRGDRKCCELEGGYSSYFATQNRRVTTFQV